MSKVGSTVCEHGVGANQVCQLCSLPPSKSQLKREFTTDPIGSASLVHNRLKYDWEKLEEAIKALQHYANKKNWIVGTSPDGPGNITFDFIPHQGIPWHAAEVALKKIGTK